MTATYRIDLLMLGEGGTDAIGRRTAEILTERGYPTEYVFGTTAPTVMDTREQIPDKVFFDALNDAVRH